MKNTMIIIYILLFISILINIAVCLSFGNRKKNQINQDSKIEAQLILLDRKISQLEDILKDSVKELSPANPSTCENVQKDYDMTDMDIHEMAKKMNKSIKEVELMLKMRGLR